jgi:hypothetical protein
VKTVEEIIKYLEYAIAFSKWGIDSLRTFPTFPKKGQDISGNTTGSN